jgi:predicted RNase H-like HicB family nuclease
MPKEYTLHWTKEERGGFSGRCVELDITSRGRTLEELRKNLIKAIKATSK